MKRRLFFFTIVLFSLLFVLILSINITFAETYTETIYSSSFPKGGFSGPRLRYKQNFYTMPFDLRYADIIDVTIEHRDIRAVYVNYLQLCSIAEDNGWDSDFRVIKEFRTDPESILYIPEGSISIEGSEFGYGNILEFVLITYTDNSEKYENSRCEESRWKYTINYNLTPKIDGSPVNSRTVELKFKAMSNSNGKYKLYRDDIEIEEWTFNEFKDNIIYIDEDLNPNTVYTYKLIDPSRRESDEYSVTTKSDVPSAPTVNNITQTTLSLLNYSNYNPSTTKYEIYRKDMTANTDEIMVTNSAGTTFNDSGLTPGHRYRYRIKAVQSNGVISRFSLHSYAATIPPAPFPINYEIGEEEWQQAEGRGSIKLSWASLPNTDGYKVWVNDGYQFRVFDVGNVTSWDSLEWKIYPTETELSGYDNNTVTDNIFNTIKGGLDLRDNPNNLYLKTSGTVHNNSTHYEFKMSAYNNAGESGLSPLLSITLPNRTDFTPPLVDAIELNDGILRTGSTSVKVKVTAHDVAVPNYTPLVDDDYSGLAKIQISNDNFATYTEMDWNNIGEQEGTQNFSWSIPPGEGTKPIYIRVVDRAGNVSVSKSGSIYLKDDNQSPEVSMIINDGQKYTTDPNLNIVLNAFDDLTPITELKMRFSFDGAEWTEYESFRFVKTLPLDDEFAFGIKRVFVQVVDGAGNVGITSSQIKYLEKEEIVQDKISIRSENDTVPPVIETFMLERAATVVTNDKPTVELSIYDNVTEFENLKVQFRLTSTLWTDFQNADFVMTPNLTLENGLNSLYIRVFDENGNKAEKRTSFLKL